MADVDVARWSNVGGVLNNKEGAVLVSGTTIAPTHPIHRVSGTGAIVNITLPSPDFAGTIVLIPAAASTFTNAGNIAVAGTHVALRANAFTYVPSLAKWYPSYV